MAIVSTILTVIFVILCILLILIILIQSNRSSGMSLFGGGANSAFGASSADVITKSTGVMVVLFFVVALAMPFFHSKSAVDGRKLGDKTAQEDKKAALETTKKEDNNQQNDAAKIDGAKNNDAKQGEQKPKP